jgi:hypothetical protein
VRNRAACLAFTICGEQWDSCVDFVEGSVSNSIRPVRDISGDISELYMLLEQSQVM